MLIFELASNSFSRRKIHAHGIASGQLSIICVAHWLGFTCSRATPDSKRPRSTIGGASSATAAGTGASLVDSERRMADDSCTSAAYRHAATKAPTRGPTQKIHMSAKKDLP